MIARNGLVVVLLALFVSICQGVELSVVQPRRMKHLERHNVLGLSAVHVELEPGSKKQFSYYFSPEVTTEGYFRFDENNTGYAVQKSGYYGLIKERYRIQFGLENCRQNPKYQIKKKHCLCYETKGSGQPSKDWCGKDGYAFVCFVPEKSKGVVKYLDPQTNKATSFASVQCDNVLLKVDGSELELECGQTLITGVKIASKLPVPKVTGQYMAGRKDKVKMINLEFKECGSVVLNNLYYTQNLWKEKKPMDEAAVHLTEDKKETAKFDGSTCQECSCDRFEFEFKSGIRFGVSLPLVAAVLLFFYLQ
ncbi:unnamed protein product [Bursaphelenchus okinawaensis]|uniref:Uncharacterized protein n=1 Tax=Bursaphelenchus okinawaensis TaxID=465554 RepID=A0A811LBD6_9BILA|nr:unnamed protein product [Bursaphelenchus okinawaensis]CAG9120247.1 unnamed protein product [Bursaphelenchus okinawaensis]